MSQRPDNYNLWLIKISMEKARKPRHYQPQDQSWKPTNISDNGVKGSGILGLTPCLVRKIMHNRCHLTVIQILLAKLIIA